MDIKVKPEKIIGKMKPMHCVGGGPDEYHPYIVDDAKAIFREIGVPACRLHDVKAPYGSNQYVDIHCIFPDFDADENDEASYNFGNTDDYLLAIADVGAEVFFRLGESIDHFKRKLHIHPPKDYGKWARICEHIIRHYNEGWANGFNLGIRYWEIWNEPEGTKNMWTGTREQFYELYDLTAKHLKSCFPNIMIGGYSAVGVYSEIRDHSHEKYRDWFDTLTPFLNGFFDYIKEQGSPIDFFSWHIYALKPEEISDSAKFVRKYLDDRGYTDTESYLTEFNYDYSLRSKPTLYQHTEFTADVLASLIQGQNSPVDAIYYYDFRTGAYNGMFYTDPLVKEIKRLPGFNAMKFFGDLYRLGNQVEAEYDEGQGFYALSASDGESCATAISSRTYEGRLDVYLNASNVTLLTTDGVNPLKEERVELKDGKLTVDAKPQTIYYIY